MLTVSESRIHVRTILLTVNRPTRTALVQTVTRKLSSRHILAISKKINTYSQNSVPDVFRVDLFPVIFCNFSVTLVDESLHSKKKVYIDEVICILREKTICIIIH